MFESKLLKQAWEDEVFTWWGMRFDVDAAEKLIQAHPRQTQTAPRAFLESFVGSVKDDSDEEKEKGTINIGQTYVNKEHVQNVDISKPGIVAQIQFKPTRQFPDSKPTFVLIDGNHRAKKSLIEGQDFQLYVLTPEESWKIMAPNTYQGLTKNLVNPTKKAPKPRVKKVQASGETGYAYHATNKQSLLSIAREGLVPQPPDNEGWPEYDEVWEQEGDGSCPEAFEPRIFAFEEEGVTRSYAKNFGDDVGVVLRFPLDSATWYSGSTDYPYIYTSDVIPPDKIEMFQNGQWVPLIAFEAQFSKKAYGGVIDFATDSTWHDVFYGRPTPERIKELGSFLRTDPNRFVRLYHGTDASLPVLKQGLLPTSATRRRSLQSSSGYVYLSVFPNMAEDFGRMGNPGKKVRVYGVEVTIRRLLADTDQLSNKRSVGTEVGNSLAESLAIGHGARVKGKIDPMQVFIFKDADEPRFKASFLKKALPKTHQISLQEAQDRGYFGPVYHGTTNDNRGKIDAEGFKVYEGETGSEGISNGYSAYDGFYYSNIPAPVHHLGYGVYFTTVKSIAKMYNGNSTVGLKTYYLDVPNLETINFAAPKTMMKWWTTHGYDPELARRNRVEATKRLTDYLKSHWDAVWFKGKTLRKALDGDQICVYDPSRVYEIDPSLSKPGDIGSKVRRKSDGMKGVIRRIRNLNPEQSQLYHGGATRLLEVKWQRGVDYNVKDTDVDFL